MALDCKCKRLLGKDSVFPVFHIAGWRARGRTAYALHGFAELRQRAIPVLRSPDSCRVGRRQLPAEFAANRWGIRRCQVAFHSRTPVQLDRNFALVCRDDLWRPPRFAM